MFLLTFGAGCLTINYIKGDLREVEYFAGKAIQIMQNVEDKYQFEDPRYHSILNYIYFMLNDEQKSLENAKLALSLYPPSKDHLGSQNYQYRLAISYAVFGYEQEALIILEELMNGPSEYNWKRVKYDPLLNKLLGQNRKLEQLIDKDEKKYRSQAKY